MTLLKAINRIISVRLLHSPTGPLLVTTTVALQVVLILITIGLSVGIPTTDAAGWRVIVVAEVTIGSVITMYPAYAVTTGRTRQIALFRALGITQEQVHSCGLIV